MPGKAKKQVQPPAKRSRKEEPEISEDEEDDEEDFIEDEEAELEDEEAEEEEDNEDYSSLYKPAAEETTQKGSAMDLAREDDADMDGEDDSDADDEDIGVDAEGLQQSEQKQAADAPTDASSEGKAKTASHKDVMLAKDSDTLYKSNMFRMQLDELLKEVKVEYDKLGALESFIRRLKEVMDSIPGSSVPANKASVPPSPAIRFDPPASTELVGSYMLKTICKPQLNIDIAVQIPASCFPKKDRSPETYLARRAAWVRFLAASLAAKSKAEGLGEVSLEGFQGDIRKPIIVLAPKKAVAKTKSDRAFFVRILPTIAADIFPAERLAALASSGSAFIATAVAEDVHMLDHFRYIHERCERCASMRDAIVLLKVWLQQREMRQPSTSSFSGFMASMLLCHLLDSGKINKSMSTYQILRVALVFLSSLSVAADSSSQPALICVMGSANAPEKTEAANRLSASGAAEVLMLDPSLTLNLAARMPAAALTELAMEAKAGMRALDSSVTGGFDELFMKPVFFRDKFDCILGLTLPVDDNDAVVDEKEYNKAGIVDGAAKRMAAVMRTVERGVGQRCLLIRQCPPTAAVSWAIDQQAPSTSRSIHIGLLLNPETCFSIVEKGPAANDPEKAEEFRNFWGPKAEVRRFKDGAIIQAAVWEEVPKTAKHAIVKKMLAHLLDLHHKVKEKDMTISIAQLDGLLAGDEESVTLVTKFDDLVKRITSLTLPLKIRSVLPTSAALRYTEVCPPATVEDWEHPPAYIAPLNGVIRFESSGAWPEDVTAIRHVKTAFYIEMSQGLRKMYSIPSCAYPDSLEVFYKGHAFVFKIHVERELSLLRISGESGIREASALSKEFLASTVHHNAVHGLALKHLTYAQATRLAKRWVRSHLFTKEQISDQVIELLVAHCYTAPEPLPVPRSHFSGFMRFLRLLSSFATATFPQLLISDFDHGLSEDDYTKILDKFQSLQESGRISFPLVIYTPHDKDGTVWTRAGPNGMILRRLAAFAQQAFGVFSSLVMSPTKPKATAWQVPFKTPLHEYDFVIHLSSKAITRIDQQLPWLIKRKALTFTEKLMMEKHAKAEESKRQYLMRKGKLLETSDPSLNPPFVGFDPASLFLKDLKEFYGEQALFFHNEFGGDCVGVVWIPTATQPQTYKAGLMHNVMPAVETKPAAKETPETEGSSMVVLNVQEVLRDVERLGAGLVDHITCKGEAQKTEESMEESAQ